MEVNAGGDEMIVVGGDVIADLAHFGAAAAGHRCAAVEDDAHQRSILIGLEALGIEGEGGGGHRGEARQRVVLEDFGRLIPIYSDDVFHLRQPVVVGTFLAMVHLVAAFIQLR